MDDKVAIIFENVYDQIMSLLSENRKIEVVGLCFGTHNDERIELRSFVAVANLDNSATSFSLDYEILYREIQHHEEMKEKFVGIFHSHPREAKLYPSEKDLKFMRYWPFPYLWLIGGSEGEGDNSRLAIYALLNENIIKIPYSIRQV